MEDLTAKTVREIALESPVSTRVFEEYRIDYCCGGRKPLAEACREAGVSADEVAIKLGALTAESSSAPVEDFDSYPLGKLVEHILETHHVFTRSEIANLGPLMAKVADKHGGGHSFLLITKSLVYDLFADLESHMRKEEVILFPFIKQMENQTQMIPSLMQPFGSVRGPVSVMMLEHDRAGELLRNIRKTTNNFELPEGACPSFAALFTRLEALEKDLHQHIHLENNILFPKALVLEEKFLPAVDAL
jgi:regulator of cell morphogenesis and NO signaling